MDLYLNYCDEKSRILIIEDDENISSLIGLILETQNRFEYAVAKNGSEALKLIVSDDFDIILTDLNLPDIHGFDIARTIRLSNKNVPIIAVTADVTKRAKDGCYDAGMNDFISKPFGFAELIHKINCNLPRVKSKEVNFIALAKKMIA